jgi:hypothetical protein
MTYESIDAKMARILARVAANREACPACEARAERVAIMEVDGELSRSEAEYKAREAHPCAHMGAV